ncbi:MAG TPA: helix-hairpin-helix domain-containing protein [Bacteroidota bacterium]|nr:helix-hairpin-helix domain-containing protein [Bacteroidota bacterium]
MKARLKQFLDSLNFTSTERIVVLSLVGAFIVGLGIRLFNNDAASPRFDYSASDAEFARKSAARTVATTSAGMPDSLAGRTGNRPPKVSGAAGRPLRVDLNRASKRELMGLPGIGEVIAERILLYREEHGAFGGVADLLKINGIGKKKLEMIAPHCFVEK